jgi:Domain of Unknown Function (DUF1080)
MPSSATARLVAAASLGVAALACTHRPAAPMPAASVTEAGWRSLFDGATLRGWRTLGADTVYSAHWTVADGAIRKTPSGAVAHQADGQPLEGGDLMTVDTFGDFELAWEWKVAPGANSGVKYNVSEELSMAIAPVHAAKAFEYQVIDDDRHPDGKLYTHKTADLYDLIAANAARRVRPVGEWNASRIVFRGTHGEHWLNGAKVVEYDLGSPSLDSALARSKYRTIPHFADRRRGHIVLQDHGDEVWFRNLRLRELDAGAPTARQAGPAAVRRPAFLHAGSSLLTQSRRRPGALSLRRQPPSSPSKSSSSFIRTPSPDRDRRRGDDGKDERRTAFERGMTAFNGGGATAPRRRRDWVRRDEGRRRTTAD